MYNVIRKCIISYKAITGLCDKIKISLWYIIDILTATKNSLSLL